MKKAFTLIEFLVLLAIVFILFALVSSRRNAHPRLVVIDGCEYLQTYNGHGGWNYTHKGNCTNSIHYSH